MKKLIYIIVGTAVLMSSCQKEVLDKEPLDVISDAAVFEDEVLIDAYLASVYIEMTMLINETPTPSIRKYTWEQDQGTLWASSADWAGPYIVNEITDESKDQWLHVQSPSAKMGGIYIHGGLLEWWEYSYKCIRDLNYMLEQMVDAPVPEEYKKTRVAEARFLRAYNYFAMVKRYGGVPLHTRALAVDAPEDEIFRPRAKEQEVYDFIITEMDLIKEDLPVDESLGRPSKYAALALKSRAALYAATIADFGEVQLDGVVGIAAPASDYYQISLSASQEIISGGLFALYDEDSDKVKNFKNIFIKKDHNEKIWVLPHNDVTWVLGAPPGNAWNWDFMQAPEPHAWTAGNKSAPYLEMAEEFEYIDSLTPGEPAPFDRAALQQGLWDYNKLWGKKDPRFHATIYTQDTEWQGTYVDYHVGILLPDGSIRDDTTVNGILPKGNMDVDGSFGTGFGVMKFLDESHSNMGERSSAETDWTLFRYAEILLNAAEAAFELGDPTTAMDYVNEIRTRAGIRTLTTITRENIRHERKVELAFEGQRYWDLRRWRVAADVLTVNRSGLGYIRNHATMEYRIFVLENLDSGISDPVFFDHNIYFPITMARTADNPKLVENPGYQ